MLQLQFSFADRQYHQAFWQWLIRYMAYFRKFYFGLALVSAIFLLIQLL